MSAAEDPRAEAEAQRQARELIQSSAPQHSERRGLPFSGQGGQPLPASERAFFEPRLGVDLSAVRLHTGPEAAEEARRLHAKAFTVGPNIYMGPGRLQPGAAGRRLLGHELSHVVQQAEGGLALQREDEELKEVVPKAEAPKAQSAEPPDVTDEVVTALTEGAVEAAKSRTTLVPPSFIETVMGEWRSHKAVQPVIEAAMKKYAGTDTKQAVAVLTGTLPVLLKAIESDFIYAQDTSSLDLLPGSLGPEYREFDWDKNDFPKGPKSKAPRGPNEAKAIALSNDLTRIRPERRANQGSTGVFTKDLQDRIAANDQRAILNYIKSQLVAFPSQIPSQSDQRLNKHAMASLEKMHAAARADGVELRIKSAWRPPEESKERAAKSGNEFAIASFSSHNLGLAIDFTLAFTWKEEVPDAEGKLKQKLTHKGGWTETLTDDFPEVVRMRESPVHKWLIMRGPAYGWYPYHHEPWHFEYNPSGFRDTLWSEAPEEIETALSKARDEEAAEKAKAEAEKKAKAEEKAKAAAEKAKAAAEAAAARKKQKQTK